ncbi:MAG: class II D-tagatose-bisphosphate aldolase non-catalytic subunit, partial [Stenotrophomonas sp.]
VQPGVDFDHSSVHHYDPAAAQALSAFVGTQPRIVFEAHSTDYQTEAGLHALVRDHFAILKVGPAATYAFREAVFALAMIERELLPAPDCSQLIEVLDRCMQDKPASWRSYYQGDAHELRLLRAYSLSDRSRYYWGEPPVRAALATLMDNLTRHAPPLILLSQFLPEQRTAVETGALRAEPLALIQHKVGLRLAEYARACARNVFDPNNEAFCATELSER